MEDNVSIISDIIGIMRDCWDLPSDCNEGELFAYAEVLFDRIEAGDERNLLYKRLDDIQSKKMEMPSTDAYKEIVDRSVDLVHNSK